MTAIAPAAVTTSTASPPTVPRASWEARILLAPQCQPALEAALADLPAEALRARLVHEQAWRQQQAMALAQTVCHLQECVHLASRLERELGPGATTSETLRRLVDAAHLAALVQRSVVAELCCVDPAGVEPAIIARLSAAVGWSGVVPARAVPNASPAQAQAQARRLPS